MSSQVAGDLALIESGPCSLRWGGTLLGHTMEGVRLNMGTDLRKRMADEFGTNAANMVHQGDNIEVSTTVAELSLLVMTAVFSWGYDFNAELYGWGALPGQVSDDVAETLIVHPLSELANTSRDVTFWKMVPTNVQEVEFGSALQDKIFGVTWGTVIDESKSDGYLLARMGLPEPEVPDGAFALSDGSPFQLSDGSYFVL